MAFSSIAHNWIWTMIYVIRRKGTNVFMGTNVWLRRTDESVPEGAKRFASAEAAHEHAANCGETRDQYVVVELEKEQEQS